MLSVAKRHRGHRRKTITFSRSAVTNQNIYQNNNKRVVVTGVGLVTPLGSNVEDVWQRLIAGESGVRKATRFSELPCEIAAEGV